ncbi:MAG: cobalamin biosynthesis protein CobD [Pseudomonadota bacterium]|jgi:adenosylcobinamide-phosphate synthase
MLLPLPGAAEAFLILLMALVVEACLGDLRWLDRVLPRPPALLAGAAAWADRRLNRIERSDGSRRLRGMLTVGVLAGAAVAAGAAVTVVSRTAAGGWLLELLILSRCLDLRGPWTGMRETAAALARGGVEEGRKTVAPLTDRQAWSLDIHGVIRAAVEHGAARLLTGLVAPVLFYALFALPGLLLWAAAAGMRRVIGHVTLPRYRYFGQAAAALHTGLGFLPALLTGLLLAGAALFVPNGRALGGLRTLREAAGHPAGVEAWPYAAMAGALDLSLAGPRREGEMVVPQAWIGRGRARATLHDLRPAISLFAVTAILAALLVMIGTLVLLRL